MRRDRAKSTKNLKPTREPYQRSRIEAALRIIGVETGRTSEKIVDQVLQELQREGKILNWQASRVRDRRGIDREITVGLLDYEVAKIPLQIKSGLSGLRKHLRECQAKGTRIPIVVVGREKERSRLIQFCREAERSIPVRIVMPDEAIKEVKRKIMEIVSEYLG